MTHVGALIVVQDLRSLGLQTLLHSSAAIGQGASKRRSSKPPVSMNNWLVRIALRISVTCKVAKTASDRMKRVQTADASIVSVASAEIFPERFERVAPASCECESLVTGDSLASEFRMAETLAEGQGQRLTSTGASVDFVALKDHFPRSLIILILESLVSDGGRRGTRLNGRVAPCPQRLPQKHPGTERSRRTKC